MIALFLLIDTLLEIYMYVVIAHVGVSWLVAFGIINLSNHIVLQIYRILSLLVDPVLHPIRRFIPALGGIDLSPLVVLFAIYFLRNLLARDIAPVVFGY